MAQREIQGALRELEQRLRNEFRQQLQESLRNQRLREIEERPRNTEQSSSGGAEQMNRLEKRMEKLELSVKRAMEKVFPRVEALVSRLEEPTRASAPPAVIASKSSAASSSMATAPSTLSPPAQYLAQWEMNKDLDAAVKNGKVDDVRRLVGAGADFQKIRLNPNNTPLMEAALKGHSDVLLVLLESGADVHAANARGSTALTCAAEKDLNGKCVVLLIGAGADLNCKGPLGFTPLHYAANYGNLNAVLALLEAGANKKILNNDNKAPFSLANSEGIRRLLQF